jgi:hypothetical protein
MRSKIADKILDKTNEENRKRVNKIVDNLMKKRYLINNKVYQGSEMPEQHWSDSSNKLMLWKQSLVKLDCDEIELDKIIKWLFHNASDENNCIKIITDITSITEIRADTNLLSNPPIKVYNVYLKDETLEKIKHIETEISLINQDIQRMELSINYQKDRLVILEERKKSIELYNKKS